MLCFGVLMINVYTSTMHFESHVRNMNFRECLYAENVHPIREVVTNEWNSNCDAGVNRSSTSEFSSAAAAALGRFHEMKIDHNVLPTDRTTL